MPEPAPVADRDTAPDREPRQLSTLGARMMVLRGRAAIRDMLTPAGERASQSHLREALHLLADAELELLMAEDEPEEVATAAE